MAERQIVLGATDGFRYLGIKPKPENIGDLPVPKSVSTPIPEEREPLLPTSIESEVDGSVTIGFDGYRLGGDERLVEYSEKVAKHLGDTVLDTTIRPVGPGSIFEQLETE